MDTTQAHTREDDSIQVDPPSRRDRKGKRREQIRAGHAFGTMESPVVGPDFPPVSQCFESFPWDQTPVGTPDHWPVELHIAFSIIHNSHIPAALYIDSTAKLTFWNDQYAQTIVRSKHPTLYGASGGEVYPEVEGISEMIGGVFRDRTSYTQSAFQCFLRRIGTRFEEESFFDFTMGPLLDPSGSVYAVLNFANDRTQQNLLARRMDISSTLAARAARAQSVEGVCHSICRATEDSIDLPWMAIYVAADVLDPKADMVKKGKTKLFRLISTTFDEGLVKVESEGDRGDLAMDSNSSHENAFVSGSSRRTPVWLPLLPTTTHFHTVLRQPVEPTTVPASPSASSSTGSTSDILELSWPFLSLSSSNPYIILSTPSPDNPTGESIILPITTQSLATGDLTAIGIMVAGLNPNRMIDHEYSAFYRNVARQLESGIINGRARANDRRTAEALRRLNHQRVQFFQNTAHELRTPLTLMLGPLEELVRDHSKMNPAPVPPHSLNPTASSLPPVAQTLSRLSLISRNARRLLKLVNSILEFSSIEAGKLDTKFMRQRHFGRSTRGLCECFESLAAQSGIDLRFERGLVGMNGDSIGGSTERATTLFDQQSESAVKEEVFIDMELWEQILFNLISNAFKHTWAGSITCSMYDDFEDGRDGVRFDLIDTGVGIGEMHRDSVFERFYRADNRDSRTTDGTGIGLSLTKELVKLHGGTVVVAATQLGVGSTFSVFIPRGLGHLPRDKIFEEEASAFGEAAMGTESELDSIRDLGRSAMERWNRGTKGVERTSVLEQVDFWINEPARDPAREVEMDDIATVAPESPYSVLTPTSVARIATAKTSYFPLVSDILPAVTPNQGPSRTPMETLHESNDSDSPPPRSGGGTKRKLSDVTVSYRNTSAKRDPSNSTPVTSWYSPAKPFPSPNPTLASIPRVDASGSTTTMEKDFENYTMAGGRPRLRGLPSIDPSDRPVVLMCDDNPDMRLWISSLLQTDYNVIEARNGGAALEILATVIPDLILSDVMMPIVDGFSLVRRVRNDPRLAQIPVILLSARSGEEDSLEGLERGADDYIVKPFSNTDLLARCRVHIRLSRMRRQTAQYESELIRLQERAEAKDSLLGLVSHELRTPLFSIVSALELLKTEPGSAELIETMSKGADTLRGRIDQLLDVAKFDSDSFVLSTERFELDSVIATALARNSITAVKKGVQVFSIIGGPEIVVSDRNRLLQVLDSLLSNASKFTERGEIVLRCWSENEAGEELEVYGKQDSYLCFSVSDTGPGIPEELSSQIFLPFQLVDATSTRQHGGAGLGLALALRVVERAGGQIGVESTVGIGSKFSFRWPMQMQTEEAEINTTNFEPIILVVSARPTLAQSIYCTASSSSFDTLDQVHDLNTAAETVANYDGTQPLILFVDDQLVQASQTETKSLLDRIASHSTTCSPRSKIYAICAAPADAAIPVHADFHGSVSAPFHRKQVLAVISDILSKRNRYSAQSSTTESEPDSLVCTGDPFPRGRLLIAEDNKINAKLLIRQLRTLGYAADEAEHGLRVLDLIHAEGTPTPPTPGSPPLLPRPYRGILMDLDMPTMDGFEATRRVRSMGGRFESMPIMAVTANAAMGDKEKCIGAGMDDFVSKPISIAQLTALLKRNGLYSIASD